MLNKLRIAAACALAVALTTAGAGAATAASTQAAAASAVDSGNYLYGYIFRPNPRQPDWDHTQFAGGVTVTLSTCATSACTESGTMVGSDVTDSTGAYQVDVPAAGDYVIQLSSSNPADSTHQEFFYVDGATKRYMLIPHVAPQPSSPPKVVHPPAVGSQVRAAPGTWPKYVMVTKVIWLRDGTPIPGQRHADWFLYTPKPADFGHRLSFRLNAQWEASDIATVTSKPVVVSRAIMHASAKAPATVKARHTLPVTGHVYGTYGHVTGTVTLRDGTTVVASAPVDARGWYTLTVRPRRGSHRYRVRYSGDQLHRPATSRKLVVTATR